MKTIRNVLHPSFIAILCLIIILGSHAKAQQRPDKPHKEKKEKIKAQKIAFISDKLDLSPRTAQLFWPVYNEAEAQKEKEMKAYRNNYDIRNIDLDKLSEEELSKMVDSFMNHRQRLNEIDKIYHLKYKDVLSSKQLILLYEAEKQFRFVLLKQVRERQKPGATERR